MGVYIRAATPALQAQTISSYVAGGAALIQYQAGQACDLFAVAVVQGLTQLVGESALLAANAWREAGVTDQGGDVAGQADEAFFGQGGLIQGFVMDGALVAQITFIGQPEQGAQAALMAWCWAGRTRQAPRGRSGPRCTARPCAGRPGTG